MTDPRVELLFRSLPANYPRLLEQSHPHVLGRLMDLWGTPEFEPFIHDLMLDTRGGRNGFALEVLGELMFISELHSIFKNDGLHFPTAPVANARQEAPQEGSSPEVFQQAIEHGQLEKVATILNTGVEIDYRFESGRTPLIVAAASGQADTARFLIERGARVDLQEDGKYTALHWAAYYGHERIIAALAAAGAAVNVAQNTGDTPLALAVMRGHRDAARLLLELRANPNLAGSKGRLLDMALRADDAEMIELLRRYGARSETE